jgi:hypothetical protein
MANLLIGSSNVYRHYKVADFPNIRQYKMLKCTHVEAYVAYLVGLVPDNKTVLISVFENFIVDAVGDETGSPEVHIDQCIKDFLQVTLDAALRFPNTRFGMVLPLRRPALLWYNERIDKIKLFIGDGIKAMISERSVNNVSIISCISDVSQQFETDMIHLTAASGAIFLEVILEAAEKFFDAPLVDLTGSDPNPNSSISSLEARLDKLERSFRGQLDKAISDNLMFARTREEMDSVANKAKEDRIVINGLTSPTPLPADPRQRIETLKDIVNGIFGKLIPGFEGKVVYLIQGKQQHLPQPMIEVKLDKPEHAFALRKAFAEKRKKKELSPELDSLFLANCVNLATRVRVDILKAIAKKLTNDSDLAYVAGFTSRPTMHLRKAGAPSANTRPLKSFTFIDSVSRFGRMLSIEDLETAYGRAGRSFNGQLQQNFVVLNEIDQDSLQSVGGSRPGTRPTPSNNPTARGRPGGSGSFRGKGTKRAGDDFESSKSKK